MSLKIKWFLGICVVALVAAGVAPWTFSGSALRREVAKQIADSTGLESTTDGRAIFALLPRPRIKIENFHARDPNGVFSIDADVLRGDLRILPMLAGRLELANASLMSPRIDIALDRLSSARVHPASEATTLAPTPLSSIALIDGRARLHRQGNDHDISLDGVDMSIDWRGLAAPLTARGTFKLGDDSVETALWIGKPSAIAIGQPSPLIAKFDARSLALSLDGTMAISGSPQYDGKITASTPSLEALTRALKFEAPDLTAFGAASLGATARLGYQGLTLADARIGLAGSTYDGAITVSVNGSRPSLSGTLATDLLDLTPYAAAFPKSTGRDGQWSRDPLPLARFDDMDVDLRVSATTVRLGRVQATGAGLSILASDGHIEASLAEAKAFRGDVKGRIVADRRPDGLVFRAQAALTRVDFASILTAGGQAPRMTGLASGTISIGGAGADVLSIARNLKGVAQFDLRGGEMSGLDIEQALRRIERRPLSIASELRGGKTAFDDAKISISVDQGIATIERAEGSNNGIAFALSGAATFPTRELALRLSAWQTSDSNHPVADASRLGMDIKGTWDNPEFLLDTRSLIERSRAAAPLWTGGAGAATTTDAAPPAR
jgi:AsmA protein